MINTGPVPGHHGSGGLRETLGDEVVPKLSEIG